MVDVPMEKTIRKAIKNGDLDLVVQLLDDSKERLEFISAFGPWLHVAAGSGHLSIVKWLVSKGADVNALGGISGGNALLKAVNEGHLEIVMYLFGQGSVLETSECTRNPLFRAITSGYADIARFLIEQGIDTTVVYTDEDMKKMDALELARLWGQTDICRLIEEANKKASKTE